jgi:xanthine dehydrogenase iron-sulfur cluster and FAD-binding subunit A
MEEIASRSSTLSTAKLPSGEARGASNLRRCTGYDEIVRAVLDAAAELRGERDSRPLQNAVIPSAIASAVDGTLTAIAREG